MRHHLVKGKATLLGRLGYVNNKISDLMFPKHLKYFLVSSQLMVIE